MKHAYLRDHLRDNLKILLYITIFSLAITFVFAITGQITENWRGETQYESTVGVPVFILIVCCYVVPVIEFGIFKKRINLDCLYALPIRRRELAFIHYITGLITVLVPYILCFAINALLMLRATDAFRFEPLLPLFFSSIGLGIALYSFFVFVFNEANTRGDGIWFMVLWTFILSLILGVLYRWTDTELLLAGPYCGIPWAILSELTTQYDWLIETTHIYHRNFSFWQDYGIWYIFWCLAGVAGTVGFFLHFGRQRTEKTEEISDSIFGFKTLIPLYAVTGMIEFEVHDTPIFWLIIEVLAVSGYTIYRRGFHYKKSDIAILVLLVLFLFL